LFGGGAGFDGLEAEIGERADVDVVDFGMTADFLVGFYEFQAVLIGELAAAGLVDIGADGELKTYIPVGLRMLMRDGARADHSDSQELCSIATSCYFTYCPKRKRC